MDDVPQCQAMVALEFDMTVRKEASAGFHQIRSIEHQLRLAPQGTLGKIDGPEQQALRAAILNGSATIVASFSRIISLLSTSPNTISGNELFSPACGADRGSNGGSHEKNQGRAESPMSTNNTSADGGTPPHSPRRVVAAQLSHATGRFVNSSSPAMSPALSSVSRSGMSDGSPNAEPVGLDSDGEAAGGRGAGTNDASTSAAVPDADQTEQRALARKRKFMPKYTCKQLASGMDAGNDGPPDDGHTWRKYGQKEILGSRFPRSYYRCTHKHEVGCPAIKYVQRSDEEPIVFDVTYRGNHTCQSMQQQPPWPFPFSREQIAMALTGLPPSNTISNPMMSNFATGLGGIPANSNPAQSNLLGGPPNDSMIGGVRPSFPQFNMNGSPSKSSQLMASRFGNSSNAIDLGFHQNDYPVKLEGNNTPLLPQQGFNSSGPSRDNQLFGRGSNLLNLMLAGTKSAGSCRQGDDCQSPKTQSSRLGRVPVQGQRPDEQSNGLIEKVSETHHYNNSWGQGPAEAESLHSSQQATASPAPCNPMSRFDSARPIPGFGQSRDRGWQHLDVMEADPSELAGGHVPPFSMGLQLDSPVGIMDYEPFVTQYSY